jgi:hypothetical protein
MNNATLLMLLFLAVPAHAQEVIVPGMVVDCESQYNQIVGQEQLRLNQCVNNNYPNTDAIYTCQQIVERQTNDELYNEEVCREFYETNNLVFIIVPGSPFVFHPHHVWHHERHEEPTRGPERHEPNHEHERGPNHERSPGHEPDHHEEHR